MTLKIIQNITDKKGKFKQLRGTFEIKKITSGIVLMILIY